MPTGAADHTRILAQALAWRGSRLALATVVDTWRSAPCPVGTHLLVHEDGAFVGSVSGGCVEGDVLHCAAEAIAGSAPTLRRYGVADADAWQVGLPCGGEIAVLVQAVRETEFPPDLFDRIARANAGGEVLSIATDLTTGISALADGQLAGMFLNVYAPPKRLLIVGAVEIAVALAGIAQQLGFAVTVIDPRARFLTAARFPQVVRDDRWPDAAVAAARPDSRTAVVVLSHDPKIDDPALVAALAGNAGYVAALGSRASHAARLDRLRGIGIEPNTLVRIEGPAGVAINAIAAPEIALSIAAGMVRAFNAGLR